MKPGDRSEDEIKALSLHRLKRWNESILAMVAELTQMKERESVIQDQLSYSLLEAREELSQCIKLGMTEEEIKNITEIPKIPIDPLSILQKTKKDPIAAVMSNLRKSKT